MTKLIKILESVLSETVSEQITMDDGNNHPEKGLSVDEIERREMEIEKNKKTKLEKVLRLIFKQMKKISGIEEIMTYNQNHSEHFYSYVNHNDMDIKGKVDLISKIPKFFGAKDGGNRHIVAALIYTFINNGGYGRDFSEGELDLKPLVTYDVDANTERETTSYETSWGEVFANSEEEAIEKFQMNPENWVSDSEHDSTDYGDYLEVSNTTVTNTNERHLTLINLGFV